MVEALRAEGVRHVFGIPGVHNLAVYDALLGEREITHILARHEQGAGFMADGYARASGRPGVVLVTSGPGATNALTPLVESWAGSQPVLLLMSDIPLPLIGRDLGALHEVPNQIDCFRPVTRWAETVKDGSAIAPAVQRALSLMRSERPGPVALSLPFDLLTGETEGLVGPPAGARPGCDRALVARAAELLRGASRPAIIAGGGVVSADAGAELARVARRLGAPVITTVMGRGAVSEGDSLWLGVLPNKLASAPALAAADVVLAVGCRFAHRSTQGLLLNLSFTHEQRLIHLDLDPTVPGKLFKPELAIIGDARDGLGGLADALGAGPAAGGWDWRWLAGLREARSPRYSAEADRLIRRLREGLADDAVVVSDQTGINYWMEWHFPVLRPRTFLYPVGSATLGYAVPAAIGAKIGCPDRQVIAVVGDGGFLFSVSELATAVKYGLGVVFLVVNDQRYGAIKYLQERMFGRWGEADLANPDFPALARAFGAAGERVEGLGDLPRALGEALARPGPTVLELPLGIEPPWEV